MLRGEDRSSFNQRDVSWSRDVFGFAKATEGESWTDPSFPANWANLKREGKVRGAYHFFHPALNAVKQAQFFVNHVRNHGGFGDGDIFIADVEITVGEHGIEDATLPARRRMNLPLQALTAYSETCVYQEFPVAVGGATGWCESCRMPCGGVNPANSQGFLCAGCVLARAEAAATVSAATGALEFLNEVEKLVGPHCPVVLYTDLFMAVTVLGVCHKYPLFVADYAATPPNAVGQFAGFRFWQSREGGGQGGGDTDWFNGDEAKLHEWLDSYLPKPPPGKLPKWQQAIYARLPRVELGASDKAGQVSWVHQVQLLADIHPATKKVTVDGVFAGSTEAAVKAVQKAGGVTETGRVTADTWPLLAAGAADKELPTVHKGSKDGHGQFEEVHRAQALVNVHGVALTIDGDFGQATADAVKVIQAGYHEKADGVVGPVTWSLLLAHARP